MSVYRFKVYFEDDESVYREIEIQANQNFEDLQSIIQKAIEFDNKHAASFFISNDTWRKGKEIKLLRDKKKEATKNVMWMHLTKIAPYVEDPHQKIIYEYDPLNTCWTLHLELLKILPDSPISYPRISKSKGKTPVQYKVVAPIELVAEEDEEESVVKEDDNYVNTISEKYAGNEKADEHEEELQVCVKAEEGGEEEFVAGEEDASDEGDEDGNFESEELN